MEGGGKMAQVRDIKARISLDGESAFRKALSMSNNSLKAMREELKTVTSEFNQNDDAVEKTAISGSTGGSGSGGGSIWLCL